MWKCSRKFKGGQHETHDERKLQIRKRGRTMTIRIALTEEQRSLLQLSLEIARDKFKEHARSVGDGLLTNRLADQFAKQAKQADELLLWVTGAENVIIEERRD
jgi:hypothetical protein